jgi:hypothetical protein
MQEALQVKILTAKENTNRHNLNEGENDTTTP